MSELARFGPAGNSDSFYVLGYKHSEQIPDYLQNMNLNAFEYQCGSGVNIKEETAVRLGNLAAEKDIKLSLHAPYYISLSSIEEQKRLKSIDYIVQSAHAVKAMGGDRIIVHSGSCAKLSREAALALAMESMRWAIETLDANELSQIHICPETMGKTNQLGTLEEVLALCTIDERMIPCIDFGHLNARSFGKVQTKEDFCKILDMIGNHLGKTRQKSIHVHFSKIEYTSVGGEKKHLTFEDNLFGPDYIPLIELLVEYEISPIVICESDGTQAEDAAMMRSAYELLRKNKKYE